MILFEDFPFDGLHQTFNFRSIWKVFAREKWKKLRKFQKLVKTFQIQFLNF